MRLNIIILAAGAGTRMHSELAKVLHPVGGQPMLEHVINAARVLQPRCIQIVYGHGGEQVRQALGDTDLAWVEQPQRLGTGHAVMQAMATVTDDDTVLVLYGDVPLIQVETLQAVVAAAGKGLGLLTGQLDDPSGYGRIVRDAQDHVTRVVEHKDASAEQRSIREVNTGFMALPAAALRRWLAQLTNDNAQGEYYLTDVVGLAVQAGVTVQTVTTERAWEVLGVNNRLQLAIVERHYQRLQAEQLMLAGVTLSDPARFDVRGTVVAGRDVSIDVNVVLEGRVVLGDGVRIGPQCVIRDAVIGAGTEILSHTLIEQAEIGAGCRVGPFARVRPGTCLAPHVHIGNFVEVKATAVGEGSKINHLSYIGDATVGRGVNIGAGTITCNYDGANKFRTVIEDHAFIGSDTQLVAPVRVGAGATIGAGSTITRDAPPGELTLSRNPQQTRAGWRRPVKKKPSDENTGG